MHVCSHCGRHRSDPRDYLIEGQVWPDGATLEWTRVRAYSDEEALRQVRRWDADRHVIGRILPFESVDPQIEMPYGGWHSDSMVREMFGVQLPPGLP